MTWKVVSKCNRCGEPIYGPEEVESWNGYYPEWPTPLYSRCKCSKEKDTQASSDGFGAGFIAGILFCGLILATVAVCLMSR